MFNGLRAEGWTVRYNFGVLVAFFALLLLFGGASRADVIGQAVVRIAAILVLVSSGLQLNAKAFARVKAPAILLGLLTAVIGIQLVPLSPGLWASLPGHGVFNEALKTAEVAPVWRPISVTPDLTLNALLALLPAAATLSLLALMPRRIQPSVLALLLVAIAVSTAIGILQISTGGPYFYQITNNGSAVGSFANRNHSALFVALALPLLAGGMTLPKVHDQRALIRFWGALCAAAVVFPILLVTGSRAGLLLGVIGIAGSLLILLAWSRWRKPRRGQLIGTAPAIAVIVIVATVFALSSRDEALRRLLSGSDDDVRSNLLPTFLRMIADYFPFGSGFGSFDPVYRMYEPHSNLSFAYLNQAHNDWAQIVMEGGLPALLLLLAALGWFASRSFRTWRSGPAENLVLGRTASVLITMIGIGSLFDYPLRTPLMGAVVAIAAAWMALDYEAPGPTRRPG